MLLAYQGAALSFGLGLVFFFAVDSLGFAAEACENFSVQCVGGVLGAGPHFPLRSAMISSARGGQHDLDQRIWRQTPIYDRSHEAMDEAIMKSAMECLDNVLLCVVLTFQVSRRLRLRWSQRRER